MRSFVFAAALVVATLSCRERPHTPAVVAPTVADRKSPAPDLSALAQRLDPGAQPPLSKDMPGWLSDSLAVSTDVVLATAAVDLSSQWTAWSSATDVDERGRIYMLMELVRASTALERALARDRDADRSDALFAIVPVYALFDVPPSTIDRAAVTRMMDALVERRGLDSTTGDEAPSVRADQLRSFAIAATLRADLVHRHALAELVRAAPGDPRMPDALVRGAAAIGARDSELSIALARAALQLRGTDTKAQDWLALARACYGGLDPECGDEALQRAWKTGGADEPAIARGIESAVADGTRVRRLLELRDEHGLEPVLERARLSFALGRRSDAIALFGALVKEWPADARAAVGLAELHLASALDFAAASAVLDAVPRPPAHAEDRFWELAVGTRATVLGRAAAKRIPDIGLSATLAELAPEIETLAIDIRGLAATGSDAGIVLQYLSDHGREAMKPFVAGHTAPLVVGARRMLPDVLAIARRFPASVHAQRLLLAGTSLSADRTATFAALQDLPEILRPMPAVAGLAPVARGPGKAEIAELRAQWMRAWLDASIVWGEAVQAEMLQQRLFEGDSGVDVQIVSVDAQAFVTRVRAQKENWQGIASTYQDTSHAVVGERRARLLHNAGVAMIEAGQRADGEVLLRQAMAVDPSAADLASINLFAAGIDGIDLAPLRASADLEIRMLALGLAMKAAQGAAARKRLTAEFRGARARHCRESVEAQPLPGPAGIVLRRRLQIDLGVSTQAGLQLQLETTAAPWLLVSSAYAAPLSHLCPSDRASARRRPTRADDAGRDSHP